MWKISIPGYLRPIGNHLSPYNSLFHGTQTFTEIHSNALWKFILVLCPRQPNIARFLHLYSVLFPGVYIPV